MTDDLLRSARQMLAELQATEIYLRTAASRVLPYSGILGVERRAAERCNALLDGLGVEIGAVHVAHVDVAMVAAPAAHARKASPAPSRPGPPSLKTLSAPPSDDEDVADAATADGPIPASLGRSRRPPKGGTPRRMKKATPSPKRSPADPAAPRQASSGTPRRRGASSTATSGRGASPSRGTAPPSTSSGRTARSRSTVPAPAPPAAKAAKAAKAARGRGAAAPKGRPSSSGASTSRSAAEPVAAEALAEAPTTRGRSKPKPGGASADSLVSFEDRKPDTEPAYINYDDGKAVEPDPPAPPPRRSRPRESVGSDLVSFEEAEASVGSDALVTLDRAGLDLGDALDAPLDEPSEEIEFAGDVDAFDDEAATMVKVPDPPPANSQGSQDRGTAGRDRAKSLGASPTARSTGPQAPKRVTSGLYGGTAVPTIRDSNDQRPRAAAIQLNSSGTGGRVLGLEEEAEPIAVGAADNEDEYIDSGSGFSVSLQHDEYDDDLDEYDEMDLEEVPPASEAQMERPIPVPAGPTPEEIAEAFARAQAVAATGDLQESADLYSDVIDADPDHVAAHVARGRLYLDLGDYSRAMSDFMVAEEIAADSPEPQVAIGDLYFARKDYRKAIEYFNAALDMSPNHAMAFCRRGISHYYRKNYPDALDDLLRAQRIQPDIPNIMTYVSMAKKKAKSR